MLGVQINRTATIVRLNSGKLVIHSSGPFSPEGVTAIHTLGEPGWLVEATNVHDMAMPRAERWGVQNKAAFEHSLQAMMAWDFDRVIAGRDNRVETTKAALNQALREAGFCPRKTDKACAGATDRHG